MRKNSAHDPWGVWYKDSTRRKLRFEGPTLGALCQNLPEKDLDGQKGTVTSVLDALPPSRNIKKTNNSY